MKINVEYLCFILDFRNKIRQLEVEYAIKWIGYVLFLVCYLKYISSLNAVHLLFYLLFFCPNIHSSFNFSWKLVQLARLCLHFIWLAWLQLRLFWPGTLPALLNIDKQRDWIRSQPFFCPSLLSFFEKYFDQHRVNLCVLLQSFNSF